MFKQQHSRFTPLKEELSIGGDDTTEQESNQPPTEQVVVGQSPSAKTIIIQIPSSPPGSLPKIFNTAVAINDDSNENPPKERNIGTDLYERQPSGPAGITGKVIIGATVVFLTNSFASGFNIGVLNTPEQILKSFFNQTLNYQRSDPFDETQIELIWSAAVSILVVGALITSIGTGYLANRIGRRPVIFLNITIGLAAMFLTWGSRYFNSIPLFMAGRLVAGFHTGIASGIVPMYLMEIAPKSSASSLGALHVMGLNFGLFLAQVLGLENILGTVNLWQMLFFVNAVIITIGLLGFYFIPESPVYLFVIRKREDEAIRVLIQLRQQSLSELSDEINLLRHEQKSRESNNASFFQLLAKRQDFRWGLLIVCVLHAGQQLVGINAVLYYSTSTFRGVGFSQTQSQYGTIGISFLNAASAMLAGRLLKSFSPRKLMLLSTIGTTLALMVLPITMTIKMEGPWLSYLTIFAIYFYVFMFSLGQGPIPFMIGGELFDSAGLGIGLSCGCFVNWFFNFLVAFTFPLLVIQMNQFVFLIFFFFDFLLLFFVLAKVPETRSAKEQDQFNKMVN